MRQILRVSRALHPRQVGLDDLADVSPERAQAHHHRRAPREDGRRRVHPRDAARARVLGLVLRLRGARGEVLGDVREPLRRVARVAQAEPAHDGVRDEDESLGRLHRARVAGRRRRANLGVDRRSRLLLLRHEHRAAARRDTQPAVGRAQRVDEVPLDGVDLDPLGDRERLAVRRRRGHVVAEPPREGVDQGVAQPAKGIEAPRLRLAHLGRDDHDGGARAPFGPRQRIVVLRLHGDLDGHVAPLHERIAQPQNLPALAAQLAVQPGDDAPLFPDAGAEHQVHLAQPVIVGRDVLEGDVLVLVHEQEVPRRALERDDGREVGDSLDVEARRLLHDDVAEANDDAQRRVADEAPARDDGAGSVFHERHVGRPVAEPEEAAGVHGHAAQRDERPRGEDKRARHELVDLFLPQVLGRPRGELDPLEPAHRDGRHAAPREKHVRALEHGPRVGQRHGHHADPAQDGRRSHARRDPRRPGDDAVAGNVGQRARDVQLGERRRRADRADSAVCAEQRQRAEGLERSLAIHPRGEGAQHVLRLSQPPPRQKTPCGGGHRARDHDGERSRAGPRRPVTGDEDRGDPRERDERDRRSPPRRTRGRVPRVGEPVERLDEG